MNRVIVLSASVLAISCAGRVSDSRPAGDIVLTCPDIPAGDDTALVSCLDTLDQAIDACEQEPTVVREDHVFCAVAGTLTEVASAAECDTAVALECARGTTGTSSRDGTTLTLRCVEQDLTVTLDSTSPSGDLIVRQTGIRDVAKFRVRNNGTIPATLNGVTLRNVIQDQPLGSSFNVDVVRGEETESACVGRVDPAAGDLGCSHPLSSTTLLPSEEIVVVVRIQTPSLAGWPNSDGSLLMSLGFREQRADAFYFLLADSKPTVSQASGTPSGQSNPGNDDVAWVNLAADSRGDIILFGMTFEVRVTDNDLSGWADRLLQAGSWSLVDIDDQSVAIDQDADWQFQTNFDGSIVVYLYLSNFLTITNGNTRTYLVRTDTTGASTAGNDTFQLTMTSISWADGHIGSGSYGINNLPVAFPTLNY